MLWDLINFNKLRRAVIYALLLALVMLFQDALLSELKILGVKSMFVPAMVVAVGLFEGGVWGGVFGLAAGFFCDMCYSENTVLFTVLFPLFGFLSGWMGAYMVNRRFFAYLVLCAAALCMTAFCQMFRLLFIVGADPAALCRTAALQVLWSLPLAVPLYFPPRSLSQKDRA